MSDDAPFRFRRPPRARPDQVFFITKSLAYRFFCVSPAAPAVKELFLSMYVERRRRPYQRLYAATFVGLVGMQGPAFRSPLLNRRIETPSWT